MVMKDSMKHYYGSEKDMKCFWVQLGWFSQPDKYFFGARLADLVELAE